MSSEIKVFRIYGFALFSHDKVPEWRKFVVEIRALKPEHALEKLYSEFGSRHKMKRSHIRVVRIEEVPPEQAVRKEIRDLAKLTKVIVE
ncbi:MAG: 50S ribosomal protein L18a [Thermoprotei archaeon]|nr:MAG: 50S ribosomal protein L18a [Thermoprotei archaeon]